MKLYVFRQNNSGGQFLGEYINIFIEAENENEAIDIAEQKTSIYFDGCDFGRDCECCGDRWNRYTNEYSKIVNIRDFIRFYNKQQLIWEIQSYKDYSPHSLKSLKNVKDILKRKKETAYWGLKNLILLKNGNRFVFDYFSVDEYCEKCYKRKNDV